MKRQGQRVIGRSGSWAGFSAQMWLVPEQRVGVVMLVNGQGFAMDPVIDAVLRRLLPLSPPVNVSLPVPVVDSAEFAEFVGTYENERVITLLIRDGQLYLREEPTALRSVTQPQNVGVEVPLTPLGGRRFAFTSPDGEADTLEVLIGAGGGVEFIHTGGRALAKRLSQ